MNQQQAKKFFDEHKTRYVLAQFVDIHGSAKAKAVPVEHLDMVLTDGAGFAGFARFGSFGSFTRSAFATSQSATTSRFTRFARFARFSSFS